METIRYRVGLRGAHGSGDLAAGCDMRIAWLVCILYLVALMFGALHGSIWFDESYSLAIARWDAADIWRIGASDVHPVLYYLVLHTLRLVFGESVIVYRLFSALGLAATILLGPTVVRAGFGPRAARRYVLLVACCPYLLFIAEQIRMYSWAVFAVAVCMLAGMLIVRNDGIPRARLWVAFAHGGFAAACLHYYGAMTAFCINAAVLMALVRSRRWRSVRVQLVLAGIQVACYLPWALALVSQTGGVRSGFWIAFTVPGSLFELLCYPVLTDTVMALLRRLPDFWCTAVQVILMVAVLVGIGVLVGRIVRLCRLSNGGHPSSIGVPVRAGDSSAWHDARFELLAGPAVYLGVILLGLAISLVLGTPVLYYRYLSIPFVCLIMSVAVGMRPPESVEIAGPHRECAKRYAAALRCVVAACVLYACVVYALGLAAACDDQNARVWDSIARTADRAAAGSDAPVPVLSGDITAAGVLAIELPELPLYYAEMVNPSWSAAYAAYEPHLRCARSWRDAGVMPQGRFLYVFRLRHAVSGADPDAWPHALRVLERGGRTGVTGVQSFWRPYEGMWYVVASCVAEGEADAL